MQYSFVYGTVRESDRRAIYVVRVQGETLEPWEIDELTERLRERLLSRGESATDVVVVQGETRETFRIFGAPYSVSRVRTALFNAAVSWSPITLD
jgi:hypothetical protein